VTVPPVVSIIGRWLLLHQALEANEWIGIVLIVLSNVVVSARGFRSAEDRARTEVL
jgi:inner membrane transporter RhtA